MTTRTVTISLLPKLISAPSFGHHWKQLICNPQFTKDHSWPNISADDPDPGSGSKNLNLNRDHFWLDDPVEDLCFSGKFERKFLEQPMIVYEVFWLNFDNVRLYHVHYVPWAWTRFKKPTILFRIVTTFSDRECYSADFFQKITISALKFKSKFPATMNRERCSYRQPAESKYF